MLIEKVVLIQFDEVAERARIERAYKGAKGAALLAILDAFVAGDFAKMYLLARDADGEWLGHLAMPVSEVLHDVHTHVAGQSADVRSATFSKAEQKRFAQRGIPFGPEAWDYPKFFIRGQDGATTPATVPLLSEI
jgi:hypothetical protein